MALSVSACSAGGTATVIGSGRPLIPLAIRLAVPFGLSTTHFTFPCTTAGVEPATLDAALKRESVVRRKQRALLAVSLSPVCALCPWNEPRPLIVG
jgi:hypothetical protein